MQQEITEYLTTTFGEFDMYIMALLLLMCLDFFTGIAKSIIGNSEKSIDGYLNSSIMWKGGIKKVFTLVIIAVATILNSLMLPEVALIRVMTITYYISVEAISVVENAIYFGLPIPDKLINILETLKNKNDK